MGRITFRAERSEESTNPLWLGFAVGKSADEIRAAVHAAERQYESAETTRYLVRLQAIRALAESGMSSRMIAGTLGLSKSAVGRHLRFGTDGVAVTDSAVTVALIRQAWGDGH